MSDRSLAHLPAHQLEDALNCVLVEAQQAGDSPTTKPGFGLDHLLNRISKALLRRPPGISSGWV